MAVANWIKTECPTARLHLAAAPMGKGAMAFFHALGREKVLGTVAGQIHFIKELYHACDVIVTPHRIATRVVREGFAMGKHVIQPNMLPQWWHDYQEKPGKMFLSARKYAEKNFRIAHAGHAIKKLFEKILTPKPKQRKVFLDIGGHLGETVRRFYREVEDARHWEIYTFEPHPECFEQLKANLSRMKNVTAFDKMVAPTSGETRKLFVGSVNGHEGSTALQGKTTGGVDYANPIQVQTIGIENFLKQASADYVVLKMNIEGGEYELMHDIITKPLMGYFNQIYVQTHKHKLPQIHIKNYAITEKCFADCAKHMGVDLLMQEKGMARFQCNGGRS
jgi:FkbM family methyltransferase